MRSNGALAAKFSVSSGDALSRIGLRPVPIPDGVQVTLADGNAVTVSGPKGALEQRLPAAMRIEQRDGSLFVSRPDDERQNRSLHGLTRQLLNNMVVGVSEGYERRLEIQGTGFRVSLQDATLDLQLGFSHPNRVVAPDGIEFEVPNATHIVVRGVDKQLVGEVAARIRKIRPPDAYKGKGVRYEGEQVRRKPGKAAITAAVGAGGA